MVFVPNRPVRKKVPLKPAIRDLKPNRTVLEPDYPVLTPILRTIPK